MSHIVVATGLHTHVLLRREGAEVVETAIPQSRTGLETLLALKPETVTFVGNREWSRAMAESLRTSTNGNSPEILFVAKPTEKGVRQSVLAFGWLVLERSIRGRDFFEEKRPLTEPDHQWYQLALGYLAAANELREARHHLLSTLVVLFPEVIRPSAAERGKGKPVPEPIPPGTWTRGMIPVLANPDPWSLAESEEVPAAIRILAASSLGRDLPKATIEHYRGLHREHLKMFNLTQETKARHIKDLSKLVEGHLMLRDFSESDSMIVLTALIGWRRWEHFNYLRHFAGLAVSRIDGKGNARISRQRGPVRQYLYLVMTKTTLGRAITEYMAKDAKLELARVLKEFSESTSDEAAVGFIPALEAGEPLSSELYDFGKELLALSKKDQSELGQQRAFVGRRIVRFNSRVKRIERLLKGLWWFYLRENPIPLPDELRALV